MNRTVITNLSTVRGLAYYNYIFDRDLHYGSWNKR